MTSSRFPIYIVSKGRAFKPMTANLFIKAGIPFLIAVEPQEEAAYAEAVGADRVLVLPFSNLGLGSFPARNYCWQHAQENGASRHWVFDDNIKEFRKWVNGKRVKCADIAAALAFVEDHAERVDCEIAGFDEYDNVRALPKEPFRHNTHIYSAMLLKNEIPYRWRLKYNEDVDLCLQVLHDGGSTENCRYYVIDKVSTAMKMKGGNQDELYQGNDPKKKLLKAKMLQAVWPNYVRVVIRFNRFHHFIDWNIFKKKKHG